MSQFPNPSTQFQKGQSGNPGGMSKEMRAMLQSNAEKALRLQQLLIEGVLAKVEQASPEEREAILRADVNKIIGDALDRHLGKAVQQIDSTSSDGSTAPSVIRIVAAQMPEEKPDE